MKPLDLTEKEISDLKTLIISNGWQVALKIFEHHKQLTQEKMLNLEKEDSIREYIGKVKGYKDSQVILKNYVEKKQREVSKR